MSPLDYTSRQSLSDDVMSRHSDDVMSRHSDDVSSYRSSRHSISDGIGSPDDESSESEQSNDVFYGKNDQSNVFYGKRNYNSAFSDYSSVSNYIAQSKRLAIKEECLDLVCS